MDTTGYIYFAIKTEDPSLTESIFSEEISIKPTKFELMYNRGKIPKCTIWEFRSYDLTNAIYYDEINKLIEMIKPYKQDLIRFKKTHERVSYVFEVVIFMGDETPALHFGKEVIQFLQEIDSVIDCDIYPNN